MRSAQLAVRSMLPFWPEWLTGWETGDVSQEILLTLPIKTINQEPEVLMFPWNQQKQTLSRQSSCSQILVPAVSASSAPQTLYPAPSSPLLSGSHHNISCCFSHASGLTASCPYQNLHLGNLRNLCAHMAELRPSKHGHKPQPFFCNEELHCSFNLSKTECSTQPLP